MPVHYTVDSELRVIFVIHLGNVGDDEVLTAYKRIQQDPQVTQDLCYFVDLSDTNSESRSNETLHRLADRSNAWRGDSNVHPRVAILAPQDLSYGLARMYKAISMGDETNFRVFRDLQKAVDWLGVPASAFEKVRSSIGKS